MQVCDSDGSLVHARRGYLHGCWPCARGIGHPQRSVYLIRFSTGAADADALRHRWSSLSRSIIGALPGATARISRFIEARLAAAAASGIRLHRVRAVTLKAISLPLENWHTPPEYRTSDVGGANKINIRPRTKVCFWNSLRLILPLRNWCEQCLVIYEAGRKDMSPFSSLLAIPSCWADQSG